MRSCMDIQVNLHVCIYIQVNMPMYDCSQVDIHQTCSYIDEYVDIYAYTHKYA
jgi:hypothetical protein